MMKFVKFVAGITLLFVLAGCQARVGDEPIFNVVALNDGPAVAAYLEDGGNPNMINRSGDPLLYIASGRRGGPEVAVLLLEAGADVNGQSRGGRTVLQNATSWCNAKLVTLLLDAGADVNMVGKNGKTALDSLCKAPAGSREPVLKLLKTALTAKG